MSLQKMLSTTVFLMTAVLSTTAVSSGTVLAEACTYSEARMALEQGNTVRGMALMRMASRDGDRRADVYLAETSAPLQLSQVQTVRPTSGRLASNNPRYRN